MKAGTKLLLITLLLTTQVAISQGQNLPLSVRMADTAMNRLWQDPAKNEAGRPGRWSYEQGVILGGLGGVWFSTGDGKYFKYLQQSLDSFVNDDGAIRTYRPDEYNLDNILLGRELLLLYQVTGREKYAKAAARLREQLRTQPRNAEGGFWHKQIYPDQMWLDGIYMAEPFLAQYAAIFGDEAAFDDIAKQFILVEKHTRDPKTGLLYHGWDASKKERWADPATGHSPNFWGRAMGWYAMALVDTLDYFPASNPQRSELTSILSRLAAAIQKYQDPRSGLWYEVLDKSHDPGNYPEASASCMFVYALAKAVRLGYLPPSYFQVAQKGYQGITATFIKQDADGHDNLEGTVSVAGLGGNPYRDGSYQYYLSEKVVTNDPKGVGAFLMASNEMELAATQPVGRGKTVLLDSYFNNEIKKDARGQNVSWHYKWDELPDSGFSMFRNAFRGFGVSTQMLYAAPTAVNLRTADIYIIVDPDTPAETPTPNYVEAPDIKAITDWVKAGGVLVLMGNDVGNAEFDHFNQLAKEFGIQFNKDSRNKVLNNDFSMGKIVLGEGNAVFKTARTVYLKEISTLALTAPAKALVQDQGDVLMAIAKLGKGSVFAVGDPWLYNEYTDGRKLPPEYQNYQAAKDLARWLVQQSPARRR